MLPHALLVGLFGDLWFYHATMSLIAIARFGLWLALGEGVRPKSWNRCGDSLAGLLRDPGPERTGLLGPLVPTPVWVFRSSSALHADQPRCSSA